ncbi:MAG: hypothetical protein Q4C00_05640 [Bacillota bacterium]|nr:hypothetical protein [Bacillota bacterium]
MWVRYIGRSFGRISSTNGKAYEIIDSEEDISALRTINNSDPTFLSQTEPRKSFSDRKNLRL